MNASTIIEYLECIEENHICEYFRGQLSLEWSLVPSISRYADEKIHRGSSLNDFEGVLVEEFQKFSMPIRNFSNLSEMEKLIHCQH